MFTRDCILPSGEVRGPAKGVRWDVYALVLVCALVSLWLKFRCLRWDPPRKYERSVSLLTDEGHWTVAARNEILGFEPTHWEYELPSYVHPAWNWLAGVWMRVMGVSLCSVRGFGLLLSTVSVVLLGALLVWAGRGRWMILLCLAAYVSALPLIMYGRSALVESFLSLYAILLVVLAAHSGRIGRSVALVVAVGTLLWKMQASYLVGVTVVYLGLDSWGSSAPKRRILYYFLLTTGLLLLYYLGWVAPHAVQMRTLFAQQKYGDFALADLWGMARNLVYSGYECGLFSRLCPLLTYLAVSHCLCHARDFTASDSPKLDRFMLVWLVVGFASFALWFYRPLRYYLLLTVPLVYLAARRIECVALACRCRNGRYAILRLWLALLVSAFLLLEWKQILKWNRWQVATCVVVTGAVLSVYHVLLRRLLGARREARLLPAAAVIVVLAWHLVLFANWENQHAEELTNANNALRAKLRSSDMVLVRHLGAAAAFDSDARMYIMCGDWTPERLREALVKTGASVVLIGGDDGSELTRYLDCHATLEATLPVGPLRLMLYRVRAR